MIYTVTVVNDTGDMLTMELRHPEKSGLLVKDITGIGPVKADINTTKITTSDGSIYNSSRLNERNIVFTILPQEGIIEGEEEYSTVEDNRLKLSKYFPLKRKVQLYFRTENRFAYIEGRVESNSPGIFSKQVQHQISVICPFPYFYDAGPDGTTTTYFSGIVSNFEFPVDPLNDDKEFNDMSDSMVEFSELVAKAANNVPYNGDAETGVIMKLHAVGTVENIIIFNTKTRERMIINTDRLEALTGSKMVASDEIIIDTHSGEKSITLFRNGSYTNILNCVNRGADWFQIKKGDNVFAYTAEVGASNLQFEITAQTLFETI